jgi:hypothetical protein
VHPFKDGNGRLHRYLIHEQLSAPFTPERHHFASVGSDLRNPGAGQDALSSFARRMNADRPGVRQRRYRQRRALSLLMPPNRRAYEALERTVEHDLTRNFAFAWLRQARGALTNLADWPAHSLDLFIRAVRQNGGKLAATKRPRTSRMTDDEVSRFQNVKSSVHAEIDDEIVAAERTSPTDRAPVAPEVIGSSAIDQRWSLATRTGARQAARMQNQMNGHAGPGLAPGNSIRPAHTKLTLQAHPSPSRCALQSCP